MKKFVKFKGHKGLNGVYNKDELTIEKYYEVVEVVGETEIKDMGKVITVINDTGHQGIYSEYLFE